MRFRYSRLSPAQDEEESLPRVPLFLFNEIYSVETLGLVDSGAMVSILPYQIGLKLGAVWDYRRAIMEVGGILSPQNAIPIAIMAKVGSFPPTRLVFGWVRSDNFPLILGQMSFFAEFDVCFYRSQNEFEVKPKSTDA